MKEKIDKKRVQKELTKRDLPDSYYVIRDEPLGVEELHNLLTEHRYYLSKKALLNANRRLHLDLDISLRMDDVIDAYQEAVAGTLTQLLKGSLEFFSPNKFFGYVLLAAWRNIRDELRRHSHEVAPEAEGDFSFREHRLVSLDAVAELSGSGRASRGSLDLRDNYQAEMWTSLWENLAEAIVAGKLQFRDVAIYKHYILHKHYIIRPGQDKPGFTIDQMVAEKEFTRKQITNALRVMNTYVDNYVATMQLPQDLDYEEEAEDIFGY
jgi:hypothetical protein